MILRFAAVFALACLAAPAFAQEEERDYEAEFAEYCASIGTEPPEPGVEDPALMVRNLYPDAPERMEERVPLTDRLRALFIKENRITCETDNPIGRLDFDWVVNGQDALITEVSVESSDQLAILEDEPPRMVVTAKFKNFETPMELQFYWQKADDGWRLDDVTSVSGDYPWTLSLLLAYGM